MWPPGFWVLHLPKYFGNLWNFISRAIPNFQQCRSSTVATLIWVMQFKYIWYRAYYICLGLIFQCEFNGDVCFMIGLPYLAIISECLIWNISYISGTHFSIWIQQWCLCCDQVTLFGNFGQSHYWSEYNHISIQMKFSQCITLVPASGHALWDLMHNHIVA